MRQGAVLMQEDMQEDEKEHETIFEEELTPPDAAPKKLEPSADISFELLEIQGKWLVKVVSGPNSGAEFSLLASSTYLIGTDASSCDIVFNDLSVSRQHARITVDPEEHVTIEDLASKNGTFVDGEKLSANTPKPLLSNTLISMGTTAFMLIDREGERHTIISQPVFTQKATEAGKKDEDAQNIGPLKDAVLAPIQSEIERIKEEEKKEARHAHAISSFIVLAVITGLFVIAGIGTTMLFKTQHVEEHRKEDPDTLLSSTLKEYPTIRYSYNPLTGKLLLIGHLLTAADRSKMLDSLDRLDFITDIDYNNVVIDEYVWREINQVLAENPSWASITVSSPTPGRYIITGYLKTRKQADALNDYLTQNFPYLDLLDRRVVVEEDLKLQIQQKLNGSGFKNLLVTLDNGAVQIKGGIPAGKSDDFNALVSAIKELPGVRNVVVLVNEVASEQARIDISDKYQVSGFSTHGPSTVVVINGKILSKGDAIDGMVITDILPNSVYLEKEGFKYKIDFNR